MRWPVGVFHGRAAREHAPCSHYGQSHSVHGHDPEGGACICLILVYLLKTCLSFLALPPLKIGAPACSCKQRRQGEEGPLRPCTA